MQEQQEYTHKPYKVNEGDIITIIRQEATKGDNHYIFYKVALKNKKDDAQTYYKQISFPKGTDIKDGTRVRINSMFECARHLDRFNDTFYLYVDDYEIIGENVEKAVNEYKEQLEDNDMLW